MADYKTVSGIASDSFKEKNSEFIGYIQHVDTQQSALDFIAAIRKKHYDASHHCFAYVIKDEKVERQSDDGEPSKTAGMPILNVIKHSGLDDVVIVVVRYFGGTLLGTGGLVRAYTQSAQMAIAAAEILEYQLCVDVKIVMDYSLYDRISAIAQKDNAKVIDVQYTDKICAVYRLIADEHSKFIDDIQILTKGDNTTVSLPHLCIF